MASRPPPVLVGVALLIVAAGAAFGLTSGGDEPSRSSPGTRETATTTATTVRPSSEGGSETPSNASGLPDVSPGLADPVSDLPTMTVSELPAEAIEVLALIDGEGSFPYEQDDSVFQNREGLLPERAEGHYREYTVETPGSSDRGARRLVVGAEGARYYTDDHYESFREVVAG